MNEFQKVRLISQFKKNLLTALIKIYIIKQPFSTTLE